MSTTVSISSISAIELLDSRGNPTIEATVKLSNGVCASAISPSGSSVGANEVCELRDGDKSRYSGKGVSKAVKNVKTTINDELVGRIPFEQRRIDGILRAIDNTRNKSNLGGNAILAVSLAIAKASAASLQMPLYSYIGGLAPKTMPIPMMNILNGGKHADNKLAIQEFMIIPASAATVAEAIRMGSEIFHALKKILSEAGLSVGVGDEGGFAPNISQTEEAISYILSAIEKANYKPGHDVFLALDCAASEFYNKGIYSIDGLDLTSEQIIDYYATLISKYPIVSIEDPCSEVDVDGFVSITKSLGKKVQIVGDDIFCTNTSIILDGIKNGMCNAVLIKPNQIGTLSETLDAIEAAKTHSYGTVISHRSGESEDAIIADIAVATNAGQIKTGSLSRSDRIAKYNQLIRIENSLGKVAEYNNIPLQKFIFKEA